MRALQLGIIIWAALPEPVWADTGNSSQTVDGLALISLLLLVGFTHNRLKARPFLRWFIIAVIPLVTGIAVTAGPRLIDRYWAYHDPHEGQVVIERVALEAYPLLMTVAEKEPALVQRAEDQLVASWQANGGKMTRELVFQIVQAFQPVNARLYEVAAAADDGAVLKWAISRHQVDLMLSQISLQECGDHLRGAPVQAHLTQTGMDLIRKEQENMRAAYLEGFQKRRTAPGKAVGSALVRGVLMSRADYREEDFMTLTGPNNNQSSERLCSIWLGLSKGLLALPPADGAALTRFLFQSQPASI